MAWIKFKTDFDYVPEDEPRVTLSFRAGETRNVPTKCAEKALELKVGVKAKNPKTDAGRNA